MPSRTSYFNKTVFTKTIRRFWPLWTAFAGIWFLVLPLSIISWNNNPRSGLIGLQNTVLGMASLASPILCFFFAILTAMAVFGWLYQSRSVSFTAALPVTRDGMFLSCAAAGAAVLLGVNVLTTLTAWGCAAVSGAAVGKELGIFLAVSSMDVLCFYGFALLCAQLTGSLIILPLVYAVLQFTAVAVQELVGNLLYWVVFGFTLEQSPVELLSPLWGRASRVHSEPIFESAEDGLGTYVTIGYSFSGWVYVIGYAVFGTLCLLLAWSLYRRRRMETAGDTVAIGVLKPVFRWCLAVGCALCCAVCVSYLIREGSYVPGDTRHALFLTVLLLVGGLIGWFGADMLIYKCFNVFRYHWKGTLLLSAILCTFMLCAECDVLGLEKKIPESGEYNCASVVGPGERVMVSEKENIDEVRAIQRSIVENKALHEDRNNTAYRMVEIRYFNNDENGETVEFGPYRQYRIAFTPGETGRDDSDIRRLERLMNAPECIESRKALNVPVRIDTIESAWLNVDYGLTPDVGAIYFNAQTFAGDGNSMMLSREDAYELYTQCIVPDLRDGTLGRVWLVEDEDYGRTVYNLQFSMNLSEYTEGQVSAYEYFYTVPTVDSVRTNAWLTEHGVVLETLWEYLERTGNTEVLEGYYGGADMPAAVPEYVTYK